MKLKSGQKLSGETPICGWIATHMKRLRQSGEFRSKRLRDGGTTSQMQCAGVRAGAGPHRKAFASYQELNYESSPNQRWQMGSQRRQWRCSSNLRRKCRGMAHL